MENAIICFKYNVKKKVVSNLVYLWLCKVKTKYLLVKDSSRYSTPLAKLNFCQYPCVTFSFHSPEFQLSLAKLGSKVS